MVSQEEYFSPVPVFILFRESIEASIIVAVLLQFLNRSGPWLKSQVWWGVGLGFVVSIIISVVFIVIYYAAKDNIFQGRNQFIFNGSISLLAAFLISFLAFAMLRFLGWEEKWKRKLKEAAEKAAEEEELTLAQIIAAKESGIAVTLEAGGPPIDTVQKKSIWAKVFLCQRDPPAPVVFDPAAPPPKKAWYRKLFLCEDENEIENWVEQPDSKLEIWIRTKVFRQPMPDPEDPEEVLKRAEKLARMKAAHDLLPKRQRYNIFFLAFFTVVREGLEVVVFMAGVGNSNASAIPLSGFVGIICGMCVGVILYYTGKTIENVKWLMISMSVILFFIGAGQAENGGNSLMLGGVFGDYIPATGLPYPTAEYNTLGLLPFGMEVTNSAAAAFNDGDEVAYMATTVHNDGYINPPVEDQPWLFEHLWDVSSCCSHKDEHNRFLSLMNKIIGYNATPCWIDLVFYCGYWVIVLCLLLWKLWKGSLLDADYKHNIYLRQKYAEEQAEAASEQHADKMKALQMGNLVKGQSKDSDSASGGCSKPSMENSTACVSDSSP
eukprot:gene24889-10554_t